MMQTLGYYNGTIAEIKDMRIPMDDRASWFGDGVYDAACAVRHRIIFLEEHVERFFSSASLLQITPPFSKNALAVLLSELTEKVEGPRHFVYWQLTRGTAARDHAFPPAGESSVERPLGEYGGPNLWVFVRPSDEPDFSKPISLITLEDTRHFHCNLKTLNLIPNVLASEAAKRAGAAEAVFYRGKISGFARETVTECAHSNIHILKDGVFRTAPLGNLILPGIARAHLLHGCSALGIPVREEAFSREELFNADEVLVSSSGTFCLSADRIDGRPAGGKAPELLARLRQAVLDEAAAYTASA